MSLGARNQDLWGDEHVTLVCCCSVAKSHPLVTPWTLAHQAPLPRQEYWNELPFPSPGNDRMKQVYTEL